MMMIKM